MAMGNGTAWHGWRKTSLNSPAMSDLFLCTLLNVLINIIYRPDKSQRRKKELETFELHINIIAIEYWEVQVHGLTLEIIHSQASTACLPTKKTKITHTLIRSYTHTLTLTLTHSQTHTLTHTPKQKLTPCLLSFSLRGKFIQLIDTLAARSSQLVKLRIIFFSFSLLQQLPSKKVYLDLKIYLIYSISRSATTSIFQPQIQQITTTCLLWSTRSQSFWQITSGIQQITYYNQASGRWTIHGLAKTTTFQWYGWPGLEVPDVEAKPLVKRLKDEYDAHPVFLSMTNWLIGITTGSPIRSFGLYSITIQERLTFDESSWAAYKEVNRLFAKTIAKDVQDGDLIWVHDYHLMLLPEMLRDEIGSSKKNVKIGFFLHTPSPPARYIRILPVRESLLLGVLHCDLIGFHTYDYARHFLSSCSRNFVRKPKQRQTGVEFRGKYITVAAFPIGIDPEKFIEALQKPSVTERIAQLERKFEGVKLIVGVDRLRLHQGRPPKTTRPGSFPYRTIPNGLER
ncbi:hypothetical protein EYC84_009107 [Monilinia fructicola]|uniref:Uncharacterized protein n=1 Tax=Monilinia fructicola TaxID=38448 RepID=A0A5M9JAD5_MONFR|nr:hypothetical protein EYC84_009107 [Monilinia fructicola]